MATVAERVPPLAAGDNLTRDEFLRRWEAMSQLKRAELIGGIVCMPSPLSRAHGAMDRRLSGWLLHYQAATPGCEGANNAPWLMLEDVPQPDNDLRVLPEWGGSSTTEGRYARGAPELVAETCLTSAAYDLHQKMDLYREAGVQEYVTALLAEQEVRWHRLVGGRYALLAPSPDGVFRSPVFPGLWLHAPALLAGDLSLLLQTLDEGLRSPEHAAFVAELAGRRS